MALLEEGDGTKSFPFLKIRIAGDIFFFIPGGLGKIC